MAERASTAMVVQDQDSAPRALVQHSHAEQAILTREGLKLAAEQRALLKEYVEQQMIEGTDYGVIPGTKNNTLLKPGAEKLVELFRCTPKFTLIKEKEDYESGIFAYRFRVRLFQRDGQVVLAEGYGSCNSREARYRWRNAARKCPNCGKEAIIKGKEEYGGGWLCFEKKGGCKAKFKDGDQSIEGQEQGQVENENIADVANTCLKMAKKRALVDGAIALARVSDLFTQDAEDGQPEDRGGKPAPAKKPTGKGPKLDPTDALAAKLIDECNEGFADKLDKAEWLKVHEAEWRSLSPEFQKKLRAAFDSAPFDIDTGRQPPPDLNNPPPADDDIPF